MSDDSLALITFKASRQQFDTMLGAVENLTKAVEGWPKPDFRTKQLVVVRVHDLESGITVEGEIKKMQITDSQKCTIEFGQPVDAKGFPAQVEAGSVAFSIGDDSATVEQDADNPLKATVFGVHPAADPLVATTINIVADADLGDGVVSISGVAALLVTSAAAVGFGPAVEGAPEENV